MVPATLRHLSKLTKGNSKRIYAQLGHDVWKNKGDIKVVRNVLE